MIKLTEKQIREEIAMLERMQRGFKRSGDQDIGIPGHQISREDYTKSVLRAQIKGLLRVLGEERSYDIAGNGEVTL